MNQSITAELDRVIEELGDLPLPIEGVTYQAVGEIRHALSAIRDRVTTLEQAPTPHELKTWTEFYDAVSDGRKPFEIRLNDRGFRVGDYLRLREFDPTSGIYSGRSCLRVVTYITDWKQSPGYVVMGLSSAAQEPQP